MRIRILLSFGLISIAWIQEIIDQVFFQGNWNFPLIPRGAWWGLFTAPFSHEGYGHLISNSIIFLPLSFLILAKGIEDFIIVWLGVIIMEIPIWLLTSNPVHGLSGVIYGMLGYLILIGIFEKSFVAISLSILCTLIYGNSLFALIPLFSPQGVSWFGHFAGFLGGIISAWLLCLFK